MADAPTIGTVAMGDTEAAMIERMAKAMCERNGFSWSPESCMETANGDEPEQQREYWRDKADAAFSALSTRPAQEPVAAGELNARALKTAVENFEDETGGFGDDNEFVVRGVIKAYLSALYAAPQPVLSQPEVKALEWHDNTKGGCFADTRLGVFAAIWNGGKFYQACFNGITVDHEYHKTLAKAKAAAQSDFEQRIRSALIGGDAQEVDLRDEEISTHEALGLGIGGRGVVE